MIDKLTGKEATGLVASFEGVFKGLPHLPKAWVDFLVKVAPWLTGLGGVMSVIGGLQMMVMSGRRSALWSMIDSYAGIGRSYFVVAGAMMLLMGVLYLMAFKPLKANKMTGWMYIFWGQVLSVVMGVVSMVYSYGGGIVGTLIGAAIGFYILFEVKPRYK